jgi:hypothetical protein
MTEEILRAIIAALIIKSDIDAEAFLSVEDIKAVGPDKTLLMRSSKDGLHISVRTNEQAQNVLAAQKLLEKKND